MRVGVCAGLAMGLAISACAPAWAQDAVADRPSIVVSGVGTVERAPDLFRVHVNLEGRGADQVSALRALAQVQSRVNERLGGLPNLQRLRISTSGVMVKPAYESDCPTYSEMNCALAGYVASIQLRVEGSPSNLAGNIVSVASEAGAARASLEGFSVDDQSALRAEASRLAIESARRQATIIADASGLRLVRVLKIQEPGSSTAMGVQFEDAVLVDLEGVNGANAAVELSTNPTPVQVTSRLSVVFEVE